jgi:hypothetical protein
MSGLVARNGRRQGLLLSGKRKGFVTDSLVVWARALKKSDRTVRRYAESGVLPNAYRTEGGQWRAPFTPGALQKVRKKLDGFSRRAQPSRLVGDWPIQFENEARIYVTAYALLLALKRERLTAEVSLTQIYLHVIFALADPAQSEKFPVNVFKSEDWTTSWQVCLAFARSEGARRTALVAAYAHAGVELSAGETKDEARVFCENGHFRPFDFTVKGEVGLAGKHKRKKRKSVVPIPVEEDSYQTHLRNQVLSLAKNPCCCEAWSKNGNG